MNLFFKKLLCLGLILYTTVTFAESSADKLTALLSDLHTMQAGFVETVLDKKGRTVQRSTGKMALQRPGKFRWETHAPSRQLLIADGKNLWFYDQDLQQVTVQKQAQTEENSPAMLLSGSLAEVTKKFIVTQPASEGEWFELASKDKNYFFQVVKMHFINRQLDEMYLIDNIGQSTRLVFKEVKHNLLLSPSLFRFIPPKGVDIIKQV